MDAISTARYGLLAAERALDASAVRVAKSAGGDTADYAGEVVQQIEAKQAFQANLGVIRIADETWKALLDIAPR